MDEKDIVFNNNSDLGISLSENNPAPEMASINQISSDVRVVINKTAKDKIFAYALSDTSHELGGVLLGNYMQKDGTYVVQVEAAIRALHTEAAKSNIKFTHSTWEYIDKIKDEVYPDSKVVGWFHTHPGFGIFLSDYDLFIQRNFFNLPWQVAYVVDPVKKEEGFFGLSDGKIVGIPVEAEEKATSDYTSSTVKSIFRRSKNRFNNSVFFLAFLTLFLFVTMVLSIIQVNKLKEEIDGLEIGKKELVVENNQLNMTIQTKDEIIQEKTEKISLLEKSKKEELPWPYSIE